MKNNLLSALKWVARKLIVGTAFLLVVAILFAILMGMVELIKFLGATIMVPVMVILSIISIGMFIDPE